MDLRRLDELTKALNRIADYLFPLYVLSWLAIATLVIAVFEKLF